MIVYDDDDLDITQLICRTEKVLIFTQRGHLKC